MIVKYDPDDPRLDDFSDVERAIALAIFLEDEVDEISEITELGNESFESGGCDYLVLTDGEADDIQEDTLIEYAAEEEEKIPEHLRYYFDKKRWIEDAKSDSERGSLLGAYDGEENEQEINDSWYFIYRMS